MSQPADISLRFAALMQELGLMPDQPVVVAVSGGADSMALALLVAHWSEVRDKNYYVTVDHGIRGEQSALEAQTVSQWLGARQLSHTIITIDEDAPTSGVQAWAREKRYQALETFCQNRNCPHLLLAHHRDDQAETVLMRLMRGSGVDGLAAMKRQHKLLNRLLPDGTTYVSCSRPLLSFAKDDLVNYLKLQNQPWIEDPSNQDDHYTRVAVRQFLSSQSESVDILKRLYETAERFGRVKSFLDRLVDEFFINHSIIHPEGWVELDLAEFKKLDEELALRVLTRLCRAVGGQVYPPRLTKTTFLWKQINADDFKTATLSGTKFKLAVPQTSEGILKGPNFCLQVVREVGRHDVQLSLSNMVPDIPVMWDNRFLCRINHHGYHDLSFAVLGQRGRMILKDRLVETHDIWSLPHDVLEGLPVVWRGEALLEVPFVEKEGFLESVVFAPLNPLIKGINR